MPATALSRKRLPPPIQVPVGELFLDPENPRLAEHKFEIKQQDGILLALYKERAVNELVDSIAASGFWNHEELFAAKESGHLVVIEGNRRFAAVRLLLDEALAKRLGLPAVPKLTASERAQLQTLPVVVCSRDEVWEYIGFKHVNGPQDWDSLAKAQYIARVHEEYGKPLDEIARTIGDRHDTVKRLYRGLLVLKQAEDSGVFDREDRYGKRFAFSHLWTGLGYSGIQSFLGISSERALRGHLVPAAKKENLGDLFKWLYGSTSANRRPLVVSQNPDLRQLDEVVQTRRGVDGLRSGLPLETALKLSRGDERLLREAMVKAETALKEALGLVLTGYTGQEGFLESGRTLRRLCEKLVADMEDAGRPSTQRVATSRRGH